MGISTQSFVSSSDMTLFHSVQDSMFFERELEKDTAPTLAAPYPLGYHAHAMTIPQPKNC